LKSFCHFNTSSQEEATHKNGGRKAEDQAMGLNMGRAVKCMKVALPEDGIMGCRNM
jgi:hypothetical protein